MYRSFDKTKTVSPNKLRNEEQIQRLCYRLRNDLLHSSVVTLVGHYSGLNRHYQVYKDFFRHIYVVERCPIVASKLQREVNRLSIGKKVTILHGDFFDIVHNLLKRNVKIGCLDFDGVEIIGKNEEKLLELWKKSQAKIIIYVGSARGQDVNFKKWCAENGKRKTRDCKNRIRYELNRLGPLFIQEKTSRHAINFRTYQGTKNMFECVLVPKRFKHYLQAVYHEQI